jgi:hypothetical protein
MLVSHSEGIDTAWRVIAARRLLPGQPDEPGPANRPKTPSTTAPLDEHLAPRSLGDAAYH